MEKELDKGEIYLIRNKVNSKCYVGQAHKYVSSNNNKWGTEGRWKSHVREAMSSSDDHCLLLNQAIRKYGADNFEVSKLKDCNISEMNEFEAKYIQSYNSLVPNGYNLRTGGSKGKDSDETRQRKSDAKKKREYTSDYKKSIKVGQRGVRRNEEDNDLPDFICATRRNDEIVGYSINKFYTNMEFTEYVNKRYKTLDDACKALESLKIEHKDVYAHFQEIQNKKYNATQKIYKIQNDKLPDNIFPILQSDKLKGYKVDGLINHRNVKIPPKEFCSNTNRWNLDQAKKYIQQIQQLNTKKIDVDDWTNLESIAKRDKIGITDEYLPKYINVVTSNGIKVGYCVNGYKYKDEDGNEKKYYKKITSSSISMEEKYKQALECLEEIKQKYETV